MVESLAVLDLHTSKRFQKEGRLLDLENKDYICEIHLKKEEAQALQAACRETGLTASQVFSSLLKDHLYQFVMRHTR